MKFILGMLMAVAMTALAFVQPAEARCFWNGFETVCVHRQHFGFVRPYYGFDRPFFHRDFDRPYWRGDYQ
jgi:hypothetical protein